MPRTQKYRFHLDENFPASAGKFLASRGYNVTHAAMSNLLRGKSDAVQMRFAIREDRILLTFDRDFRRLHLARLIQQSPGVIAVKGVISQNLIVRILHAVSPNKLKGKICRASIDSIQISEPVSGA